MHVYAFLKLRRAVSLSGIAAALLAALMIVMILTPIIVRVVESAILKGRQRFSHQSDTRGWGSCFCFSWSL